MSKFKNKDTIGDNINKLKTITNNQDTNYTACEVQEEL